MSNIVGDFPHLHFLARGASEHIPLTAFNQSANPSNEQVVVFGWIAEYFESIFDDESARYCRNISESLKNQVSAQQEVKS
ncbi:hypothetical protein DFZ34_24465 [Escherichia coli]|nr:hypothetical protein [Escherichia coli]